MKNMIQKIQTLGQKAGHIMQAVESAPAKVAQMRQTIRLTAGELQQTREELQQVATGLHVENENDFAAALREITENAQVFREAGYDLAGIEMEMSHGQRLIVHLARVGRVPEPTLRYILTMNNSRVTVASILSSMIKADAIVEKMTAPNLEFSELMVYLGASPAVRLCWREVGATETLAPTAMPQRAPDSFQVTSTQAASAPAAAAPAFGQSAFFEAGSRHTSEAPPAPASLPIEIASVSGPPRETFTGSKLLEGDWKKDALERLKNSPGESKYRRR